MTEGTPISNICAEACRRLISYQNGRDAGFVSLPMLYPSGSFVTVKLMRAPTGIRISDGGFAYREMESFGAAHSFSRTARPIAEKADVRVGDRSIYVDVAEEEVERAIIDVSSTSRTVAEDVVSRVSPDGEEDIKSELNEKLDHIFPEAVEYDRDVRGASLTDWKMSAIARVEGRRAVFQTVRNFHISVYRTSTAFRDIAALEAPPQLIAVVKNRADMGNYYNILAQAGRVIQVAQSDETYRRAVAA